MKMKNCKIASKLILVSMLSVSVLLCACQEEEAQKSSFGKVDPMEDGDILINSANVGDDETEESAEEPEEAVTGGGSMKTSINLDVDRPNPEVRRMVGLCDAINMTCVELQKAYTSEDSEFVWHCIHLYVAESTDKDMGFTRVGGVIDADPAIINDVMYAMFGKLRQMPQLPETAMESAEGVPHIEISNDLKYRFSEGDRGLTEPQLRRATMYSDGSMETEVALIDSESGDEVVSFIYTMRTNTRDTTSSALFPYEITGARPADGLTSDKMSGTPFLVTVMQIYGYDSYDRDDPRYNQVDEVLYFNSFQEHVPGMDELNSRISHEILEYANQPEEEGKWHRICSYPVTTDRYVQIAATVASYPNDGIDPDIFCYNYDKSKRRAMDINDALKTCEMTSGELSDVIRSLTEKKLQQGSVNEAEYDGFIAKADGTFDVFYTVTVDEGDGETGKLVAYNSGTKDIRIVFEEGDVIPADECDDLKPVLTHGRKE